jgi:hypothetical protein
VAKDIAVQLSDILEEKDFVGVVRWTMRCDLSRSFKPIFPTPNDLRELPFVARTHASERQASPC